MLGQGHADRVLTDEQAEAIIAAAIEEMAPDGRSVLVIVPDRTRTCPLPMVARALRRRLAGRVRTLDFLIALGTHPALDDAQVHRLFGVEPGRWKEVFGDSRAFNHNWLDPAALRQVGTLAGDEIAAITGGLFRMDVPVSVNRMLFEYERVLVCGPVFPHEVVGFSGGNKYFFPGVCGAELLNFFHWLGAVITNPRIIGTRDTPVRATIDRAAGMLGIQPYALCMVVTDRGLAGLYAGPPEQAWSAAADLSARVHVVYVDRPYQSVLAQSPAMYDDIWTAGKCMYKTECVVADGGEIVIYAPHVTEISYTHGRILDEIGYHVRDYFCAQWEKFRGYPWGVLAHSTHVRGIGTYAGGVESPRIRVTLATGISEDRCRRVNLGYRDPAKIAVSEWQGCEGEGRLYVPKAGETLFRLKDPPAWQTWP